MLCPFLSAKEATECQKEKCALYVASGKAQVKMCAFAAIASHIDGLQKDVLHCLTDKPTPPQ